ncbi:MAG TPA: bacteriocin immunity protein [Anaerolineae bacterium]|nr:bacteriocin immunity protein [Anaerolineae bacterium]
MHEKKIDRDELIELVEKILRVDGDEDQIVAWVNHFSQNVPHTEASGLIFWPEQYGLGVAPSPEEIVDKALDYEATPMPSPSPKSKS